MPCHSQAGLGVLLVEEAYFIMAVERSLGCLLQLCASFVQTATSLPSHLLSVLRAKLTSKQAPTTHGKCQDSLGCHHAPKISNGF